MRIFTAAALGIAVAGGAAFAPPAFGQGAAAPAIVAPAIVTHVQTAGELATVCDPSWQGVSRLEAIAYCQGFLTSFGQYHALLHPAGGPIRPLFCVPVPGPTIAQSGIAFAAWARENTRHEGEPALDGLLRWAQASFPCAAPPSSAARVPRATR